MARDARDAVHSIAADKLRRVSIEKNAGRFIPELSVK
jgi:hypothetical protein